MSLKQDEATIAFDVGLKSGKQAFKDKIVEKLEERIKKEHGTSKNCFLEVLNLIKNITI